MTTACCTLSSCSPARHLTAVVVQEAGWNAPSSALCHRPRPQPARRRRHSTAQNKGRRRSKTPWMSGSNWVVLLLFSILICCQQAEAGKLHGGSRRFARKTDLIFDRRAAPEPRMRLKARKEHHQIHNHADQKSGNDTALRTDPHASQQFSLPHPFDTSLGNNFTSPSCPAFFNSFLNSDSFNNCLPFSLLLQVRINASTQTARS